MVQLFTFLSVVVVYGDMWDNAVHRADHERRTFRACAIDTDASLPIRNADVQIACIRRESILDLMGTESGHDVRFRYAFRYDGADPGGIDKHVITLPF